VFFKLLKISARNLLRNKRRTLITLFILVLSSIGLVSMGGFFDNLMFLMREAYIRLASGHLQLAKSGFSQKGLTQPFEFLLEDFPRLKLELQKNPAVKDVGPVLSFGGMLTNDETSIPVLAQGVDPRLDQEMSGFRSLKKGRSFVDMEEGDFLDAADPNGIIIGEGLKKALGTEVGQTVYFITTQRMGAIEGAEFHIRGVFETSIQELGDRLIKMPIATAQRIWAIPDQVHKVNIYLKETESTYPVKAQLEQDPNLKDWALEVFPWDQLSLLYGQSREFLTRILRIFQVIIFVICFFSIANTINMTLLERMKEYGTMMAIGCKRSMVFSMIMTEAGILGFIGGLVGVGFAVLLALILSHSGLRIPPPPLTSAKTYLFLIIQLSPELLIQTFFICLFSTVLSALPPAFRTVRFRIVQALGYV
jgi:putative ABC transport system permease protein